MGFSSRSLQLRYIQLFDRVVWNPYTELTLETLCFSIYLDVLCKSWHAKLVNFFLHFRNECIPSHEILMRRCWWMDISITKSLANWASSELLIFARFLSNLFNNWSLALRSYDHHKKILHHDDSLRTLQIFFEEVLALFWAWVNDKTLKKDLSNPCWESNSERFTWGFKVAFINYVFSTIYPPTHSMYTLKTV